MTSKAIGPEAHTEGNAFYQNQIELITPEYDAEVKTGRALALGATNDLPIPIHHTLGAEEYNRVNLVSGDETSDFTTNDTGFTLEVTDVGTGFLTIYNIPNSPLIVGNSYLIVVDPISITSGTCILKSYEDGGGSPSYTTVNHNFAEGKIEIIIDNLIAFSNSIRQNLRFDNTNLFNAEFNISIKQISMANSFLTIDDIANDEIIQIGNAVDGGSSKVLVDDTFDVNTDGWTGNGAILSAVDGNMVIANDGVGYGDAYQAFPTEAGQTYRLRVNKVSFVGGSPYIQASTVFDGYDLLNNVNSELGTFWYEFTATTNTSYITLRAGSSASGSFTVDDVYLIDKRYILPTSTEYILNDVTVNNILTHQMPFSAGDLNLIQQEPNLLAALAMGEPTPISSVTLDGDDVYMPCSEVSGAEVFDARA